MIHSRLDPKSRSVIAPMLSWLAPVSVGVVLALGFSAGAAAQELADYDYENLGVRAMGLEVGYMVPDNVDDAYNYTLRIDLGYLGPGLRLIPSMSYWSSDLRQEEVTEMEDRLADLVVEAGGPGTQRPDISLGTVTWSDLALGLDGHVVWSIPYGFLGYVGAGGAAHFMNGQGGTIFSGTFIEDLLDSVRAGFNLHAGLERSIHERVRIHSTTRYEVLGDLMYWDLRLGASIFWGEAAQGERP